MEELWSQTTEVADESSLLIWKLWMPGSLYFALDPKEMLATPASHIKMAAVKLASCLCCLLVLGFCLFAHSVFGPVYLFVVAVTDLGRSTLAAHNTYMIVYSEIHEVCCPLEVEVQFLSCSLLIKGF